MKSSDQLHDHLSRENGDHPKNAVKSDVSRMQSECPQKMTSESRRTTSNASPLPQNQDINRDNNINRPPPQNPAFTEKPPIERFNAQVFPDQSQNQNSDRSESSSSNLGVQRSESDIPPSSSRDEEEPSRQNRILKGRIVRTTSQVRRTPQEKDESRTSRQPQKKDEVDYYYLNEKQEVSKSPQFIRSRTFIQYSREFPIEKFIEFFDEYYDSFTEEKINHDDVLRKILSIEKYDVLRKNLSIEEYDVLRKILTIEEYNKFRNFLIEWITISNAKVDIQGICAKCKIQLTAKSELTALYSIFIPQDISKTESAVEVFANSRATFISCHFYDATRVAVIARNYSTVTFINCVFESNTISCFVMDGSLAQFIGCKFKNDKNISVFVTKDSSSQMNGNLFYKVAGKAIFVKDSSKVYITNSIFDNCIKGAATIAENSILTLDNVPKLNNDERMSQTVNKILGKYKKTYPIFDKGNYSIKISDSKNTALRAINKSQIKARDVLIENTEGNAINIENSYGYFFDCNIKNTVHPTIAVIGQHANPIFYKCYLDEEKTSSFDVICKNCCRPLFYECAFKHCKTNCISISDFSQPHFQGCSFENIKLSHLNVFSGSEVTYNDLKDKSEIIKIRISKTAECEDKPLELLYQIDDEKEEEEKQKALNNPNQNNNNNNKQRVCSWRSPTYVIPEDISVIDDPEEIKSKTIKELRQVDIDTVVEKYGDKEAQFICSKCGKSMNNDDDLHIIIPCGHPICNICKDEVEEYGVENKKCPICDSPIKEFKKIYREEDCSICLFNKTNTTSLPCAHLCMCYECASKCAENNFNCPICNEPLSSYKYIFNDYEYTMKELKDDA